MKRGLGGGGNQRESDNGYVQNGVYHRLENVNTPYKDAMAVSR